MGNWCAQRKRETHCKKSKTRLAFRHYPPETTIPLSLNCGMTAKEVKKDRRDTEKSWINSSRRAIVMIVQHLFSLLCLVSLCRLFSCGFFGLAKCFYDTNMVSWFRINNNFCWLPAVKVFLTPQSITFHEPLPKKERLQITAHIFLRWFDENNFRLFFSTLRPMTRSTLIIPPVQFSVPSVDLSYRLSCLTSWEKYPKFLKFTLAELRALFWYFDLSSHTQAQHGMGKKSKWCDKETKRNEIENGGSQKTLTNLFSRYSNAECMRQHHRRLWAGISKDETMKIN